MEYIRTEEQIETAWNNAEIALAEIEKACQKREEVFDIQHLIDERQDLSIALMLREGVVYLTASEQNEFFDQLSSYTIYGTTG